MGKALGEDFKHPAVDAEPFAGVVADGVKRAIKVNDTDVILELETGELTVVGHRHTPNGNWAVAGYGLTKFNKTVLNGLISMGILTKAQVEDHLLSAEAREQASERRYAIKRLAEACQTLGIPVPDVPDTSATQQVAL